MSDPGDKRRNGSRLQRLAAGVSVALVVGPLALAALGAAFGAVLWALLNLGAYHGRADWSPGSLVRFVLATLGEFLARGPDLGVLGALWLTLAATAGLGLLIGRRWAGGPPPPEETGATPRVRLVAPPGLRSPRA